MLNIDRLESDFLSFRGKRIRLEVPSLEVEKEVTPTSFDKLREDIFQLSKQFPHKRMALTYKTNGEEIHLEIHPITGAA